MFSCVDVSRDMFPRNVPGAVPAEITRHRNIRIELIEPLNRSAAAPAAAISACDIRLVLMSSVVHLKLIPSHLTPSNEPSNWTSPPSGGTMTKPTAENPSSSPSFSIVTAESRAAERFSSTPNGLNAKLFLLPVTGISEPESDRQRGGPAVGDDVQIVGVDRFERRVHFSRRDRPARSGDGRRAELHANGRRSVVLNFDFADLRRSGRPRDVLIYGRRHDVVAIENPEGLKRHRLLFVLVG